MDSLLLIIALGILALLIAIFVFLVIVLKYNEYNQHKTGSQRKPQAKWSQHPNAGSRSSPQPTSPFHLEVPNPDAPPSPYGLKQDIVPNRSRFSTNGSVVGENAHPVAMAFAELPSRQTAKYAYSRNAAQGDSKDAAVNNGNGHFDWQGSSGPLPQVPGYRFVNTSGTNNGTTILYKAVSLEDNTPVAVKVITPLTLAAADSFHKKLDQQLAIGYTVRHPNCAQILGGATKTHAPYFLEEWLPGGSLRDVLNAKPSEPMTAQDIRRIIGQACDALAYLHKRNINHHAVSPSYLRFDAEGELHLIHCAFGRLLSEVKRTPMGMVIGEIAYLSPEHMGGFAMTARSDIYSLGVIAFELATGKLPFQGTDVEVIRQHIETPPPNPRDLNPELSKELAQAILKALEKDPANRFQTERDMARAFGFDIKFDGYKEATNLLFVPPTSRAQSPYLNDGVANPYDFSLTRRSIAPQASDVLKMRNTATGIIVLVNTTPAVVTRELINPQDGMISRTNGQIYLQDGHWWISELQDAPSQNGLYINEARVIEPRPIHMGDKVRVGKTVLLVIH